MEGVVNKKVLIYVPWRILPCRIIVGKIEGLKMKRVFFRILTNRFLLTLVAFFLLYTATGFLLVPLAVRSYLPRFVKERFRCSLSLGEVRTDPYLLTLEAKAFHLEDPEGKPVASFDRLFVDVQWSGINNWVGAFREIRLENPSLSIVIDGEGGINLLKLAGGKGPEPGEQPSETPRLLFRNVHLVGGSLHLIDMRQSTPAEFHLVGLNLQLRELSTFQGRNGVYSLAAASPEGETFQWEGEIALSPFRSAGTLAFKAVQARTFWEFIKDRLNLEAPGGTLDLETRYRMDASTSPVKLLLEGTQGRVSDLSLRLADNDTPFLKLNRIEAAVPSFDTGAGELKPDKITVEGGELDLQIDAKGAVNVQKILRTIPSRQKAEEKPASQAREDSPDESANRRSSTPPFLIRADSVEIANIALTLTDHSRSTPLRAEAAEVNLALKAGVEISPQESRVALTELHVDVNEMRLQGSENGPALFSASRFAVDGGELDSGKRSVSASRVLMGDGHADFILDADGRLNWAQLAGGGSSAPSDMEGRDSIEATPRWKFFVKSLLLENFKSAFSHLAAGPQQPLYNLDGIRVELSNVDGVSPLSFEAAFEVRQGGRAELDGHLDPSSGSLKTEIRAAAVDLTPLQPYLEPHITLTLRSLALSANGILLRNAQGSAPSVSYEGEMTLHGLSLSELGSEATYLGFESLNTPRLRATLEPNGLEADEITLVKPAGEFIIAEDGTVNLSKILKKGSDAQKAAAAAGSTPGGESASFPFRIGRLRVDDGNVVFADLSLRPKFQTRIHGLKGAVMGISSSPDSQAKIQLSGNVDQYGMAKIDGVLSPYNPRSSTDVEMVFRNVEMANLSPYSGKFAGHRIKSGKLSLDLKYKVKDSKLQGDNTIIVDNLLLGERVESPDAVNLPLKLAVALLQDSNGRIDIGLPVSGDLNNPQFKLGPILWKAFTNLLTRIVTAPFRALGALAGKEDKELNSIEFEAGKADLLPPEKEKLKKLAQLLEKRPRLSLVLHGQYSPELDGAEYKDLNLRRSLTQRMGVQVPDGEDPGPLDFSDSKVRNALKNLFEERLGKNTRQELEQGIKKGTIAPRVLDKEGEGNKKASKGSALSRVVDRMKLHKVIPGVMSSDQAANFATEMYFRLLESEPLPEAALRQLATHRSQTVAQELRGTIGIGSERLAIGNPEALTGDSPPAVKLSLDALSTTP